MKISKEEAFSIMESLLFMSEAPRPFSDFEALFEGKVSSGELKTLMEEFKSSYNKSDRGLFLEKVSRGWQLRTKAKNKDHLLKLRPKNIFRLSRPSLEVLSIIAFEQPCTKMEIDEIRGVESGHILRALMEKEMIYLSGKSDLPGKPSLYKTSSKFLEVFGFESLKELPSQKEITELLQSSEAQSKEESLPLIGKNFPVDIKYETDEKENKKITNTLSRIKLSKSLEFEPSE